MRTRILFAVCLSLAASVLAACGSDLVTPRGVYDALRSAYESGNYERMMELLHDSSRNSLQLAAPAGDKTAVAGLQRLLPSRREWERMVDAVLADNPEALATIDESRRSDLFYRLQAAHRLARQKTDNPSDAERELAARDIRFALVFLIPTDEIGSRIRPARDAVQFNVEPGVTVRFETQNDASGTLRYVWPR